MFLYVGGTVLCESLLIKLESISRSDQHNARFYFVVFIGTPAILAALTIASERKWASTIIAAVYSAFALAFLWILPLFPAAPKLGPVFHQVTHFIPWEFPLLLIVPAFVMDLIMQRTDDLAAAGPRRSWSARRSSPSSSRCSGRSRTSC